MYLFSALAPTKPLKLEVIGTTSTEIHLRWLRPLKANGHLQQFTIEYRKMERNAVALQQYLALQLSNTTFFYTLSGLESLTTYSVQVFARSNSLGPGSELKTALTEIAPGTYLIVLLL